MNELKLNTLKRFSKHSEQLLLEHYSHCEVPAGCGGVILRWRDSAEGAMAELTLYCPRRVSVCIDGAQPASSRLLLPWGRHVLTATIPLLPRKGALMLSLITAPRHRTVDNKSIKPQQVLCTAVDGTWKYTATEPPARWQEPDFDDSDWSAMRPAPPPVSHNGQVPWIIRKLGRSGAKPIGVSGAPAVLWVRRVFTLEER